MKFLPIAIIYYYSNTNDILYPESFINYNYFNYFVCKLISHIIKAFTTSKLINKLLLMMNNTYLILLSLLCAFTFSVIKDPSNPFHNLIELSDDPLAIIFRFLL